MNRKDHIKPLTVGFLTPFYDSVIKIFAFEKFYQKIASQIPPDKAIHILDIGTGTANLAIAIKKRSPKAKILGIDPDEKILIIDIGEPKNLLAKITGTVFSLIESVGPNLRGFIPKALKEVGFYNVKEVESKFGLISFYRARK